MKPASHEALDAEQKKVQSQLFQAVELINQADGLLRKNTRSDTANSRATALLLSTGSENWASLTMGGAGCKFIVRF